MRKPQRNSPERVDMLRARRWRQQDRDNDAARRHERQKQRLGGSLLRLRERMAKALGPSSRAA